MKVEILYVFLFVTSLKRSNGFNCNSERNATNKWDAIQSPGFPLPFPAQIQCSWRIVVTPSYRVKLQFLQFSLVRPDPIGGVCRLQWVNVMDGDSVSEEDGVKICGKLSPGTFVSSGNVFRLSLHSNAPYKRFDYDGFKGVYTRTQDSPTIPVKAVDEHSPPRIETLYRNDPFQERAKVAIPANQNRPANSINQGQTQSEKVEEFNRRRNQGLTGLQNDPILEEKVIESTPKTSKSTTEPPDDDVKLEGSSVLTSELRIVLIILGVVLLGLIVFIIWRKRCFHRYITRKKEKHAKKSHKKKQKTHQKSKNTQNNCISKQERKAKRRKEPSSSSNISTPPTEIITISSREQAENGSRTVQKEKAEVYKPQSENVQKSRSPKSKVNSISEPSHQRSEKEKEKTTKKHRTQHDSSSSHESIERTKYKQKRQSKNNNKLEKKHKEYDSDSSLEHAKKLESDVVAPSRCDKKSRPYGHRDDGGHHSKKTDAQRLSNRYYGYQ